MSLLTSPPDGLRQIGWRRIVLTALAFCLAPALVGAVALAAIMLSGRGSLQAEGLATFALFSPMVGAPIWGAIAAGAAWLLRRGSFGWLPAALLGGLVFGILMRAGLSGIVLPVGAASALLYRMALALQRPEAI